jgi:hypothetical protein
VYQVCGTCDLILLPVGMLLSEIWGLVSVGRPLWREDGSAIYSVITQWSESCRTRNHTLLSHPRLPQPGGPGSRIYITQKQGGPVIPPGTVFPLRRAKFPYLYSPRTGMIIESWSWSRSNFTIDGQSVGEYDFLSSTPVGLATRYFFLSECCCPKFAVLLIKIRGTRYPSC